MPSTEQKSHAKPQPTTRPQMEDPARKEAGKEADRASRDAAANQKQREAIDYDNHEDYPHGAKDSDAPAKRSSTERAGKTPNRRDRNPKP